MTTSLLTDRYELTMLDAAIQDGTADVPCRFEVFARSLPVGRRYGVVAGVGRFLEEVQDFRFAPEDLDWLAREHIVSDACIDWLAAYRFEGDAFGYQEGDLYFAHSPLLALETDFGHGVVLETLSLSIFNYDSAIASAASRMWTAARGRPLAEFGSRRMNEYAALAGTRAAYIGGFTSTSNLEAGRRYGIPTSGTAAHAFTLLHESEEAAFASQIETMGVGTTLLVDTYDIPTAVETAVRVAGPHLGGVRIDSGDLAETAAAVRRQLDRLGATGTKITVTNDLDEHALAALAISPIDSYGVGTAVLTGSGHPTSAMVFKLTSRRTADGTWVPVAKKSAGKAHPGGRKDAVRRLNAHGTAVAEVVAVDEPVPEQEHGRRLVHRLIDHGAVDQQALGPEGVRAARERHEAAMAELPLNGIRLSKGAPAIPTEFIGASLPE